MQFKSTEKKAGEVDPKWYYVRELSALLAARVAIFGPVERMKIIMQTKHMARYANPKADMPKTVGDLAGKISLNQGMFAFYRGQSALFAILTASQTFKFFAINTLNNHLKKTLNIKSEV